MQHENRNPSAKADRKSDAGDSFVDLLVRMALGLVSFYVGWLVFTNVQQAETAKVMNRIGHYWDNNREQPYSDSLTPMLWGVGSGLVVLMVGSTILGVLRRRK